MKSGRSRAVLTILLATAFLVMPFLAVAAPAEPEGRPVERNRDDRPITLINWTDNAPTIDGINASGEWDNGTEFPMYLWGSYCRVRMQNNETHFFMYIEAYGDFYNSSHDNENLQICIDGDDDNNITYTDTDGSFNGSMNQPITGAGKNVDRWAKVNGTDSGNAGWVEWDGTNPPLPVIWQMGNSSVNQGKKEPYDYIRTNFSGGYRIFEYSIPIMTELNRTMGDTIGVKMLVMDQSLFGWTLVGSLPENASLPGPSYFPYEILNNYTRVQLNGRPVVNISSPRNNAMFDVGAQVSFDSAGTFDKAHPSPLTYEWDFGDGSATSAAATVAHSYAQKGVYNATLTVNNSAGLSNTSRVTVIVDMAPVIGTFNPAIEVSMPENSSLSFCLTASDPDGDNLTFRWTFDNFPVNESDNRTNFTYLANYLSAGKYKVNVTVHDGLRGTNRLWNLTVTDVNAPPEITDWNPKNASIAVAEAGSQIFSIVGRDIDNQTLSYKWLVNGSLQSGSNSIWTYRPGYNDSGPHIIAGAVSDGEKDCTRYWCVTVTNTNRPPVLVSRSPDDNPSVGEVEPLPLSVNVFDPDMEMLTYDWTLDTVKVNAPGPNFTYIPGPRDSGAHEVQVVARDPGGLSVSSRWFITVSDRNQAPIFDALSPKGDYTMNEGDSATFSVVASDPDGDQVTVSWYLDGDIFSTGVQLFRYSPNFEAVGDHTIGVSASDGRNITRYEWHVTVLDVNRPPKTVISRPAAGASFITLDTVEFDATGSIDDDVGDTLNYSWRSSIDGLLGGSLITKKMLTEGTHIVTLSASDGHGGVATATVTITVKRPSTAVLSIPSITSQKEEYTDQETASVSAVVQNNGPVDARDVTVTLILDNSTVQTKQVAIVLANSNITVKFSWPVKLGNFTFKAKVVSQGANIQDAGASLVLRGIPSSGPPPPPPNPDKPTQSGLPWWLPYAVIAIIVVAAAAGAGAVHSRSGRRKREEEEKEAARRPKSKIKLTPVIESPAVVEETKPAYVSSQPHAYDSYSAPDAPSIDDERQATKDIGPPPPLDPDITGYGNERTVEKAGGLISDGMRPQEPSAEETTPAPAPDQPTLEDIIAPRQSALDRIMEEPAEQTAVPPPETVPHRKISVHVFGRGPKTEQDAPKAPKMDASPKTSEKPAAPDMPLKGVPELPKEATTPKRIPDKKSAPAGSEKETPAQEFESLVRYAERRLDALEKKGEVVDANRAAISVARGYRDKGNMEKALKYARKAAGDK